MTDLTIAQTILDQLGGPRFKAMTGAKNFVGRSDGLTFQIPRNAWGVAHIRITLTPADLYRLDLYNNRGRLLRTADDIYNDMLEDVFTRYTGLRTRL